MFEQGTQSACIHALKTLYHGHIYIFCTGMVLEILGRGAGVIVTLDKVRV